LIITRTKARAFLTMASISFISSPPSREVKASPTGMLEATRITTQ
jgi:hypothetical protein